MHAPKPGIINEIRKEIDSLLACQTPIHLVGGVYKPDTEVIKTVILKAIRRYHNSNINKRAERCCQAVKNKTCIYSGKEIAPAWLWKDLEEYINQKIDSREEEDNARIPV